MSQSISDIKALLAERGIHPRKRFGQNFLIDARKLQQIVQAAEVGPGDTMLEVGPGTGVLTEQLLATGARVVAVEIDRDMSAILRERLGGHERFTLINDDVMAGKHAINAGVIDALRDPTDGAVRPFVLVANLPYNVASPLLVTLATEHAAMSRAIVMVQKEVGRRLAASPGGKDYGPLTVMIQATCEVDRIATLSPGCFWPPPQVESVVVRLTRRPRPLTDDLPALAELTQRLFQKRRKQIGSTLGRDRDWPTSITPDMRPEQLAIEQLIALAAH